MQQVGVEFGINWRAPEAPSPQAPVHRPDVYRLEFPRQAAPDLPRVIANATPHRFTRRRGQPRRFKGPARRAAAIFLIAFVTLSAALAANLLIGGGIGMQALREQLPTIDRLATLAGFGIDEVALTGQRFTNDDEVFEALDLPKVRSIVSFDSVAARARIEKLPWVATAVITRVFPGRLDIRITERAPSFVWQRGDRTFLVDVTGRTLSAIRLEETPALPRIAGEGAPAEAAALFTQLGRYPALQERVVKSERVGERRWTLHLKNNVTLHLPADREAPALELITATAGGAKLLAARDRIIDLRSGSRIAVRAAPPSVGPRLSGSP